MTLFLRDHVRSHDKSKTMYLLFQKSYGHQANKGRGLEWDTPSYHNILPLDYKITLQIKNSHKISDFYSARLDSNLAWRRPTGKCGVTKSC